MLINFTVSNYRCFRDEQQFTMTRIDKPATDGSWLHEDLSTVAGIFGPNASGKSTLLKALEHGARFIANSYRGGDVDSGVPFEPFALDSSAASVPETFFYEFIGSDGLRYKYWFDLNTSSVSYECLMVYRTNRPTTLFERDDDQVKYSDSFRGPKKQLESILRPNALLLSVMIASGVRAISPVQDFFKQIRYTSASAFEAELKNIKRTAQSPSGIHELNRLVASAGLGITSIAVKQREATTQDAAAIARAVEFLDNEKDRNALLADQTRELVFEHQGPHGSAMLNSDAESDGTKAIIAFLSVALRALKTGSPLIVDEIDRSLHPEFARAFVHLFTDPATNPKQAQLIFTAHDTSLITRQPAEPALCRDQIWFTQKQSDGAADLISLMEFSPRTTENFGRNYLGGVYGAFPSQSLHLEMAELIASMGEE